MKGKKEMKRKIDNFLIKTKVQAGKFVESKLTKKAAGDETLIVKIMLMVVAVAVVLVFRDGLKTIITNLLDNVGTKITDMYNK